jgi:hypothetical protein
MTGANMGFGAVLLVIGGWWLFARYFGRKVEKGKANSSEPSEGPLNTRTLVPAARESGKRPPNCCTAET